MKKLLVLIVALVTVFGLTACKTTDSGNGDKNTGSNDLFDSKSASEWQDYYKDIIGIDEDGNGTLDWQEKEMTITMANKFYDDEDQYNTLFRNAQKWAAKYPNITLVRDQRFIHATGDDWAHLELYTAAAQDGSLPDVFYSPKAAEMYDQDLTLDLTPYLRTDEEAKYITQNALDFLKTYNGEEIYGVAFMSVSQLPAINKGLLERLNIAIPGYDWDYAKYEEIRTKVGEVTSSGECLFPGVIDLSTHGSNYLDSIPGGWNAYNIETQRYDFANSKKFGEWLTQNSDEYALGWHFYDLSDEQRSSLCGTTEWPWGEDKEAVGNIWFYNLSFDIDTLIGERELDIDIYPMPEAPEGGTTSVRGYYDTFSVSYALENDRVKAEAAYDLVKWLTYGEEGTIARWDIINDDIETYGVSRQAYIDAGNDEANWPRVHPSTHLMDYIMGWPITTNPKVLEKHPLVVGFEDPKFDGTPFERYNFPAFKNEEFQRQLSGPVAYPRQIPAATRSFDDLNVWAIRDQIRDEGYSYDDIAGDWDDLMNEYLDNYLRSYNK